MQLKITWSFCLCAFAIYVAIMLLSTRASSASIEKLDRLIATKPSSEFYFLRASEKSKKGKHAEAIDDLEKALLLKPNDYNFCIAKAFELNRLARFTESERACNVAAANTSRIEWTQVVLEACNRSKIKLGK